MSLKSLKSYRRSGLILTDFGKVGYYAHIRWQL